MTGPAADFWAILASCERAAFEAGFRTLALMATLPGVPLYRSFGFDAIAPATVTMPDGVTIDALTMRRAVLGPRSSGLSTLTGGAGHAGE